MGELSWKHHTLIQALLFRGPLEEKDFHSIFTNITGKNPGVGSCYYYYYYYFMLIHAFVDLFLLFGLLTQNEIGLNSIAEK